MSEVSSEPVSPKKISRRGFLKGAAAVIAGAASKKAYDTAKDLGVVDAAIGKVSDQDLLNKVSLGKFNTDRQLRTGHELTDLLYAETRKLPGVNAAAIWLCDEEKNFQMHTGEFSDQFIPGSILKVPLLYHVWLRDQKDGTNNLTPEVAKRILEESHESRTFIMDLPYNQGNGETNDVMKGMLQECGFSHIESTPNGDIEISLEDFFGFLRHTEFPSIMLDAMLQTQEDDSSNYGVSKVIRNGNSGKVDSFFKIGLGKTPENEDFVSYVFIMGDLRAVGYARGSHKDVVEQMLITAGALSKYSS